MNSAVNTSAVATGTGQAAPGTPWIVSPRADLLWVIGCPVLCFAALHGIWRFSGVSDTALYAVMFAFVVTAHHMPACLRAFGEPVIYQRYKARLWTAAVAMPLMAIVPAVYGFGMLAICVTALFDLWHVAMQQHGVGRIYGAKAGDLSRHSARLDLACVLSFYGAVVLWSDSWMAGLAEALRDAGLPLLTALSPQALSTLRLLWLALCLSLLAMYVLQARRNARQGAAQPWLKHGAHGIAFGVLLWSYQDQSWFRAQSSQNAFHAMQYFFLVWVYGHLSVRRAPLQHPHFYEGLFGPRRGILRFALLIALYGLAFYIVKVARNAVQADLLAPEQVPLIPASLGTDRTLDLLGSLGIASLFLHFYVDSFIWKVRSSPVRATLGIAPAALAAPADRARPDAARDRMTEREPTLRGIAHGLGYFGIPILLIAALGAGRRAPDEQDTLAALSHEARLFDDSAAAHNAYGQAALGAGDHKTAHAEFAHAVQLAPSHQGPAMALLGMAREAGDDAAVVEWGTLAVVAEPQDASLRCTLAAALRATGQAKQAAAQLRVALANRPGHGPASLALGQLLLEQGDTAEAIEHLQRARRRLPHDDEAARALSNALRRPDRHDDTVPGP